MAVIKCKMCGGDLVIEPGSTVAECEYCGSRQTVPTADNEKKLTLFARANRLRAACEFDKAAGIYESIVADFPAEAEAYWGLVLCKYGIEYVDDPATGKKIPTCHRSSFDSVMENENFDQAMENADIVAQKVYREEAKEFERIRKGILEVSSTEKPYDIFICYKETDEKGGRTLDSVLAQDLYGALTDKGYRVFFSRITLRDKLGEAYEPYIFAALNSAKVMLAVGTCYEYYNAVWVKNEWSRYIKLCEADKSKHLIPCYKDLDPEDMPREFSHLQGADLGKMGAIQDILFNMEKYIPLKKQTVVQEKMVVGGSGDNKIASLLDRGSMALEDGDWVKADSFFEDVLNNDSKNAQAYIGKALAQERCRTLDALVRKRKDASQNVRSEKLSLKPDAAHIAESAQKYSIPGYVEPDTIRKPYDFDMSYPSEVSGRKQQYQAEKSWWANHKLLSRAEKFGTGEVAQTLQNEKKHLFTQLSGRVKQAEAAEERAAAKLRAEYAAHIARADTQAEKLYQDGVARREADYRNWLAKAKTENDPKALRELASRFDGLGDFRDSRNLAEHCRKRADEEQAKLDTEAQRQREIAEKKQKAQQQKMKKFAIIAAAAAVVVIIAALLVNKVVIPNAKYNDAVALMEAGEYDAAIAAFEALGGYKDSEDRIAEANLSMAYEAAEAMLAAGDRSGAIAAFGALGAYADSEKRIPEIQADAYAVAEQMLRDGDNVHAAMLFGTAGDYQDARQRSMDIWSKIVVHNTIAVDGLGTVALKADGTAVATGDNKYGQFDLSEWKDVISVARAYSSTIGLRNDGSIIVAGSESEASQWTDIVAIAAAGSSRVVGLKTDGTVVTTSHTKYGESDASGWTDIVAISADQGTIVGLKSDGTVMAAFENDHNNYDFPADEKWTDIVTVDAGSSHTAALFADGTVACVGSDNNEGQCNVSSWRDIVSVSAGSQHTVGVKADGTVVAVGHNSYGQCEVSDWKDIVAVEAGPYFTVGLKSDGTVVAAGNNDDGQCDVSGWTDIKLPN